jgi:hypothetical protein
MGAYINMAGKSLGPRLRCEKREEKEFGEFWDCVAE